MVFGLRYITPFPRFEHTFGAPGRVRVNPDVDNKDQGPPAELRVRPTDGELSRAARRVDAKTAMGSDGIPMSLIRGLGPRMRALVAESLTEILADAQVPETWKETRMKLLYKGKGEKADLGNYRPISITSVLYRMCTQIIRMRLQKWAEETEVLGELQNGFRTERCIEDNLFVVTQCIEVAAQEGRPLYAAFLDISKAYDTVDQNILWSRLRGLGINEADVNLLQALFDGVSVRIEWEDHMTKRIPVTRGLRQGCPLSPLLFMLYVALLEKALEQSDVGFDLPYRMEGAWKRQRIPALIYADDVVLLADSPEDLQVLLDISGELATHLRLRFNQSKSAVLVKGDGPNQEPEEQQWHLQGGKLTRQNTVKYLGVTLAAEPDYLKVHEREKRLGAIRGKGVLAKKTTWTFNRFEVVRGLWKMAIVPGLTYANSVLVLSSQTREFLERRQRDAGRMALAVPRTAPNEGVQGDLGWSSFEAREASAKALYEMRVHRLPDGNWAHRTLRYMIYQERCTKWMHRLRRLRDRYGFEPIWLESAGENRVGPAAIRKGIRAVETERWRAGAAAKPSLAMYYAEKEAIKKEPWYDNSIGSGLLAEARMGTLRRALRTRVWRARFTEGQERTCTLCGQTDETTEHLVLQCRHIVPVPSTAELPVALGFRIGAEQGEEEQKNVRSAVEVTKRRLEG
ncbi:hypothetical protein HPB47_013473 [Ixodes persulcatus]|uniref:Uncharacterized protein n=1 Tax=Ixodes persulcatus TaxID=34615 RepID=A0AC60R056_IXOPE|nr:hypothetical protein HPB47_013473 [Ixodes persulcatus]